MQFNKQKHLHKHNVHPGLVIISSDCTIHSLSFTVTRRLFVYLERQFAPIFPPSHFFFLIHLNGNQVDRQTKDYSSELQFYEWTDWQKNRRAFYNGHASDRARAFICAKIIAFIFFVGCSYVCSFSTASRGFLIQPIICWYTCSI